MVLLTEVHGLEDKFLFFRRTEKSDEVLQSEDGNTDYVWKEISRSY